MQTDVSRFRLSGMRRVSALCPVLLKLCLMPRRLLTPTGAYNALIQSSFHFFKSAKCSIDIYLRIIIKSESRPWPDLVQGVRCTTRCVPLLVWNRSSRDDRVTDINKQDGQLLYTSCEALIRVLMLELKLRICFDEVVWVKAVHGLDDI